MPRWLVDPAQPALAGDDGVCLAAVELPDITVNALEIQEAIILDTIIHDLIVGVVTAQDIHTHGVPYADKHCVRQAGAAD